MSVEITAEKQQKRIPGRPFKKGQSGNPKGRPRGTLSITSALKRELTKVPKGEKKYRLKLLVEKILSKAIEEGSEKIIEQIWDRVDGKPTQPIDLQTNITVEEIKKTAKLINEVIDKVKNDK